MAAMAVVWWTPTFLSLSDLQARSNIPRVFVWKWTAIVCVPIAGPLLYRTKGHRELDTLGD